MFQKKKTMTEARALTLLAAQCAKAEHSAGEVRDKLRRWGLPPEVQDGIVEKLVSQHFVDDERFCRAYVSDKVKYDRWGRRKIAQGLMMKHVDPDTAQRVLDSVPDDDYLEALRPLLKAKWPTIKAATDYERSMKLIKYAVSRGFELRLIRQCIDEAVDVDDDAE